MTPPSPSGGEEATRTVPRHGRIVRYFVLGTVALLLVLAGVAAWVALTPAGTRWAVSQAVARVPALDLERVEGTVGRGLEIRGLRYEPGQGTRIAVAVAKVRLDVGALWRGTLVVDDLRLRGVRVRLDTAPNEQPPRQSLSLDPPVDVVVEHGSVDDATLLNATGTVADVRHAELRGRWTGKDGVEVEQLRVDARQGRIRLRGRLAGAPGHWRAEGDANVRWRVDPHTYAGTVRVSTQAAQLRFEARLSLPLALEAKGLIDQRAQDWQARVSVPAFDLRKQLAPGAPVGVVSADVRATGTARTAALQGHVGVDDHTVHFTDVRIARSSKPLALRLERLVARIDDGPGVLQAEGAAQFDAGPVTAQFEAHWNDLALPESWAGQALLTSGRLAAHGSVERYAATGQLQLGPAGRLADVRFVVRGTPQQMALEHFVVQQGTGRLAAAGTVRLQPQQGWSLEAEARDFDPGTLLVNWPGRLHLTLRTNGTVEPDGTHGTVVLEDMHGRLRNRPVAGSGRLQFALPTSFAGSLRLRSGDSTARIEAAPGEALDVRARLRVADVGDFLPGSRGRVVGDVSVRGHWPDVRVAGVVEGTALGLAGMQVGRVHIDADVRNPTDPRGNVTVNAHEVVAGALRFEELRAEARGARAAHRLVLRASGDPLDIALNLRGSLAANEAWSGRVTQLELGVRDQLRLDLRRPVSVAYGGGALDVQPACLRARSRNTQLCGSIQTQADGTLRADYRVEDVPLSLARLALENVLPGELEGSISGEGRVRRAADALWYGKLALASDQARIRWADDGPDAVAGARLLIYRDLRLDGRLDGTRANASLRAAVGGAGSAVADIRLDALDEATPRLSGRLQANLPTLDPLAPFVPEVAGLQGRVEVDARLAGTTVEPRVSGHLRAAQLAGDVPRLGLELRAGTLSAAAAPDGRITIEGGVRSGRGRLVLDGSATRAGEVTATIRGSRFLAANIAGARVIAAPDLRFARTADGMQLTGNVRVEEAKIDLQRLPRARVGARSISPDVVIVNEPPTVAEQGAPSLPLTASVALRFDEDAVELTGYGLDATVDGRLTVRDRPGRETTASGELRVAGTYQAYGQDLTIREGEVRYAGTPIDNPRLNIEAVREVGDVVAGLRITGSAQDPQIDVFSDPSLGETDALAYLVTGRPLSAIGTAGEGDSDLLQEASQSLGTAAGGLLAKRLGQRLGIDEFGIARSEEIGGAALTIGQYLSPRLYVAFGVGLFDPGQLVTLRYDISDSVSIEAVTTDETTRAGVDYRIER